MASLWVSISLLLAMASLRLQAIPLGHRLRHSLAQKRRKTPKLQLASTHPNTVTHLKLLRKVPPYNDRQDWRNTVGFGRGKESRRSEGFTLDREFRRDKKFRRNGEFRRDGPSRRRTGAEWALCLPPCSTIIATNPHAVGIDHPFSSCKSLIYRHLKQYYHTSNPTSLPELIDAHPRLADALRNSLHIRNAWSKDEIAQMRKRLSLLQEPLHLRAHDMARPNRQKIDAGILCSSARFDTLDMLNVADEDERCFRTYIQRAVLKLLQDPQMTDCGTPMQKSSQGLLRSLLFQVLGKYPDLIPAVFPNRWASLYARSSDLGQQIQPGSFSFRHLHNGFENMIEQKLFPLKFCFLIDGLDEFSGDTEQLCMLFKRSATRTNVVKFCLSSRPWVQFQDNLGDCASLRLQDLTSNDIKNTLASDIAEVGECPPTLIEFLHVMENDNNPKPMENVQANRTRITAPALRSRFENIEAHLTARCAGLLEISAPHTTDPFYELFSPLRQIRWMHRTARDFVKEGTNWTRILDDSQFREPSAYLTLMKASVASIFIIAGENNSRDDRCFLDSKSMFGLVTNALIFAYQVNGDQNTRHPRTKLLTTLMRAGAWDPYAIQEILYHTTVVRNFLPPGEMTFLQRATLYGLSDFVEDILAEKDEVTRSITTNALLGRLCSLAQVARGIFPFMTAKIVSCLLKASRFPPKRVESEAAIDQDFPWPGVPDVTSGTEANLVIHSRALLCFLESRIYAIEAFLDAGIDPTDTLYYVPTNFKLCRNGFLETVEQKLKQDSYSDTQPDWKSGLRPNLEANTIKIVSILDALAAALVAEVQYHYARQRLSRKKETRKGRRREDFRCDPDEDSGANGIDL
ncbi:hypothetical protein G7Y89_g2688 [Cudoniella acicularis]|uniref:NACHT domain-containing protein n=1 Tax=Cudoniella acicularis TaxID=354080 RepID=A0A8H4RUS2_9HELO|nr:hypothetical protein G7Y89_g2688 [Cudoniella acicularis]